MERRWRAPLTWDNAAPRTDLFSPDPGLEDAGAVDPIEEASEWTGLPRTGSPSSEDTATGMAVSDLLDELLMLRLLLLQLLLLLLQAPGTRRYWAASGCSGCWAFSDSGSMKETEIRRLSGSICKCWNSGNGPVTSLPLSTSIRIGDGEGLFQRRIDPLLFGTTGSGGARWF